MIRPSRRHFALIAVATLSAGAASAQDGCPTRADLTSGIRLTRAEPLFSSVFRQGAGGLTETRVMRNGAEEVRLETVYAHPLAVLRRSGPDGTSALRYDSDPAMLDALDRMAGWSSGLTLLDDGAEVAQGRITLVRIGDAEVTVGGCTYPTWTVDEVTTIGDGPTVRFRKSYAPSLGLVLRTARLAPDGSGESTVIADTIAREPR